MLTLNTVKIQLGDFSLAAHAVLPAGSRTAVVGPSGAGKSTLLAAIGGFVPLSGGQVSWSNQRIDRDLPGARPISHLFQDNNLFPHLDVSANVGLGINPALKLSKPQIAQVNAAIEAVGLSAFAQRKPAALSGGQRARAAVARLLVQDKPIALLDEPFSALGPAMRQEMIALTTDVGARIKATMLMVSHNLDDVDGFADHVIWVDAGQCLGPFLMEDFKSNPPQAFLDYAGQ